MNEEKSEKIDAAPASDEGKTLEPLQKKEWTDKEKAEYNLKKKAEEVAKLGGDPKKAIGVSDDEVPEWYKREKAKEQTFNALQMAERISDDETKEQVKNYLQTRIIPSGNPEQDFRDALGAVSSQRNKQVIEELQRYTQPKMTASGGSADKKVEQEFMPTEEEARFMKPPYNIPKEKIIEARKRAEQRA